MPHGDTYASEWRISIDFSKSRQIKSLSQTVLTGRLKCVVTVCAGLGLFFLSSIIKNSNCVKMCLNICLNRLKSSCRTWCLSKIIYLKYRELQLDLVHEPKLTTKTLCDFYISKGTARVWLLCNARLGGSYFLAGFTEHGVHQTFNSTDWPWRQVQIS